MRTAEALDQFWENRTDVIREFLEIQPRYEKLAEEVAYILEKCVQVSNIEYAIVKPRIKTLDSFCEKIVRKNYNTPLKEITDIAGVRIVFLYLTDRSKIEKLIEKKFHVVEKIDKTSKEEPDRFGYGALHYLVSLDKKASGTRYDDIKDLVCEIQVRTILQDAWAIVAHHLSYKQESDVPKALRRKLNALSGVFETADDQFDRLRDERLGYKDELKMQRSSHEKVFLQSDINLDNLIEFLSWRLSDREVSNEKTVAHLLSELNQLDYTKLVELDEILSRTYDAVKAYENKYPPTKIVKGKKKKTVFSQLGVMRTALKLIDDKLLDLEKVSEVFRSRYLEFRHLVK